ncbi:Networked 4A [Hibiscus trionum]|uniref:Networked 4A n=1 Tax=Hibiscus trionum TaxID=183268 RepID=A0A9W7HWZ0_HIBTR|nr:Networked 4A [Hibiscus trionum]
MEVNMKKVDSKNMKSCCWDSHLNPENSEWMAKNSKEMDRNVKQIMKLVEDNIEEHYQIKSEVIVQVHEIRRIYQSLAERYGHLSGELCRSVPSDFLTQSHDSGLDQNSPMVTPDKTTGIRKSVQQASSFSSDGGSSELSSKEGTESSSFLSDSDSESFSSSVNIYLSSATDADSGVEHHKVIEKGSELPTMMEKMQLVDGENADDKLKMRGNRSYEELNERLAKCEEELRNSNIKLLLAEEEIVRLNAELKKSESVSVLAENMAVQLESLQRDMKMREADLELETGKVLELQKQIVELEVHVSDSKHEALRLTEELAGSKEKIQASEQEIAMLKHELGKKGSDDAHHVLGQLESAQEEIATLKSQLDIERRQVVNLQEQILRYKNDLSNRGHEVEELKGALCDAQDNFSMLKASFQSEIFGLLEKETHLEARLKEWELHGRQLEEKLRQCETEKLEMKGLYDVQGTMLQGQISQLRAEVDEKAVHVEALNKDLDKVKLKYDMLMAEKDGVSAKVNTLVAEVRSRDLQIGQMEVHLQQLSREQQQLISGSKHAKNVEDGLKLKIKGLEKEVDRQRIMIFDVAEEKREAIRQLSFTLEHYMSGYKEILKHKRHAVMAS